MLTLKQMHKLLQRVTTELSSNNLITTTELSAWTLCPVLADIQAAYVLDLQSMIDLISLKYALRSMIDNGNSGWTPNKPTVNTMLNQRNKFLEIKKLYESQVSDVGLFLTQESLAAQHAAMVERAKSSTHSMYGSDRFVVNRYSAATIDHIRNQLVEVTRVLDGITDQIDTLNATVNAGALTPEQQKLLADRKIA